MLLGKPFETATSLVFMLRAGCEERKIQRSLKRVPGLSVSGSRIASWLPSFSVEVMHTTNVLGITQASNSQLNAMVRTGCFESWLTSGGEGTLAHVCSGEGLVGLRFALGEGQGSFRGIVVTR